MSETLQDYLEKYAKFADPEIAETVFKPLILGLLEDEKEVKEFVAHGNRQLLFTVLSDLKLTQNETSKAIIQLANGGLNLTARIEDGYSPLSYAGKLGDAQMINAICAKLDKQYPDHQGIPFIDQVDEAGYNALHMAAMEGHDQLISDLFHTHGASESTLVGQGMLAQKTGPDFGQNFLQISKLFRDLVESDRVDISSVVDAAETIERIISKTNPLQRDEMRDAFTVLQKVKAEVDALPPAAEVDSRDDMMAYLAETKKAMLDDGMAVWNEEDRAASPASLSVASTTSVSGIGEESPSSPVALSDARSPSVESDARSPSVESDARSPSPTRSASPPLIAAAPEQAPKTQLLLKDIIIASLAKKEKEPVTEIPGSRSVSKSKDKVKQKSKAPVFSKREQEALRKALSRTKRAAPPTPPPIGKGQESEKIHR